METGEQSFDGSRPRHAQFELRDVSKEYGDGETRVRALDVLSLRIDRGELLVVAGPSGSGKSTLLQLLGGLDRPTSGTLEFDGQSLEAMGAEELAALRRTTFGFVFQQFNLIPTLTAAQNVEVVLAPTISDASTRGERVAELLGRVGLQARAEHLPSQLSGGEQQRVAIARALANGPDVILADEPTGNLDTQTGESILGILYSLWETSGLTVIVVTHDPAIAGSAPRVVRLADGRLADGPAPAEASAGAGASGAVEPDPEAAQRVARGGE